MARLEKFHQAVVITTSLTIEQLKKAEAVCPGALTLVDSKTGNEVFKVMSGSTTSLTDKGLVLADNNPIIIVGTDANVSMEDLQIKYGLALMSLQHVERSVEDNLAFFFQQTDGIFYAQEPAAEVYPCPCDCACNCEEVEGGEE